MAQTTLDPDVDQKHNPGETHADNLFDYKPGDKLTAGEQAKLDQIEAGLQDGGDSNGSSNDAGGEGEPSKIAQAGEQAKNLVVKLSKNIAKRGPVLGIVTTFGFTGFLLVAFFGPTSLLTSLVENLTLTGDASSPAMSRRIKEVFKHVSANDRNHSLCQASKMKCHMGKFSNKSLARMAKKGVIPLDENRNPIDVKKGGYPDKNPAYYEVDDPKGPAGRKIRIAHRDLGGFLANRNNYKIAAKVIGPGGALHLQFRSQSGKYMKWAFYDKFRMKKMGGVADGKEKKKKIEEIKKHQKDNSASRSSLAQAGQRIREKALKQLGKARKAGAGYVAALGGCIAAKAPTYILMGMIAVQLKQLLPILMETVLSPGDREKSGGLGSKITPENISSIGDYLFKEEEDSQGRKGSPIQSLYLLNAANIEKTKLKPSKFSPGFSFLKSPLYQAAQDAERATDKACQYIMSPAAMYTFMGASMATTVVASATIIGGIAKLIAEDLISRLAEEAIKIMFAKGVESILEELAKNDEIDTAKGIEKGDMLGVAATAFFSSSNMTRTLPTLTVGQAKEFAQIKAEEESWQRDIEIASLSPFDTSSRHTFLGSLLFSTRTAMLSSQSFNNSALGLLSSLSILPSLAISPQKASATESMTMFQNEEACTHFEEFYGSDIYEGPADGMPAINVAGMGCNGLSKAQASMSTAEAIKHAEENEWFNESIEIKPEDTILDLLEDENAEGVGQENGYIRADTPLYEFIRSCTDASTGEIRMNVLACVAPTSSGQVNHKDADGVASGITHNETKTDAEGNAVVDENGNPVTTTWRAENSSYGGIGSTDLRALMAITPLLLDFQILQMWNQEDEEEDAKGAAVGADGQPVAGGGNGEAAPGEMSDAPSKDGWHHPAPGSAVGSEWHKPNFRGTHKGLDFRAGAGVPVYAAHTGVITFNATLGACGGAIRIKADGKNLWAIYQHVVSVGGIPTGTKVQGGQLIGHVQNLRSSCTSGPHLHFGIETQDRFSAAGSGPDTSVNPRNYLPL